MEITEKNFDRYRIWFFVLLLAVIAGVFFLFRKTGLIVDENENYPQIQNFVQGDFRLLEISAMPGYHAVIAAISKVTGLSSVFAIRCITALFGFISMLIFFRLAGKIHTGPGIWRTLQYFLFPPVFIYYFMIYTDILSLMLVLLMLLFAVERRYAIAGLFGILSMLIRQNNVIWLAFIPAWVYFETFGWSVTVKQITEVVKKTWVFFAGMLLFVVFVILNKGVAVGDASSHPAFHFSTGNLFFILFCFFVFFLPLHIANLPKVLGIFKSGLWPAFVSVSLFALYWFTFKSDHPYNQIETHYFLRNLILTRFMATDIMKAVFFLPVLYAFWSIAVTPLALKSFYLFYVFTLLFLMPSWLIEIRYYMIPFVLFMLFRKEQPVATEIMNVVYFAVILWWLLPLVVSVKAIF